MYRVEGASRIAADVRLIAREIQQAFPGVMAWYGQSTGSWWAFVSSSGAVRLVEAINPRELREAVRNPQGWPWPR